MRVLLLSNDDIIVGVVVCDNDTFKRVWVLEEWWDDPNIPCNDLGALVSVDTVTHDDPAILDEFCQTIVNSDDGNYIEIAPWSFKTWGLIP